MPVAAAPSTWFSDGELARSRAYHRPLSRAARIRTAFRLGLLVCVHLAALTLFPAVTGERSDGLSQVLVGPLLALAPLAGIAWWLPALVTEAWSEFRHEPKFDHIPLAVGRFAVGSLVALLMTVGTVLIGAVGLYSLVDQTSWWPALAAFALVSLMVVARRFERTLTAATHRVTPLDQAQAAPLVDLANRALTVTVDFGLMDADHAQGLNAHSAGGRARPRIALSPDLFSADEELRSHIVAHELRHLAARLIEVMAVATMIAAVAGVMGLAVVMRSARLLAVVGIERASDSRSLAVVMLVVVAMAIVAAVPLAWLSRGQERDADAGAELLVGALPLPHLRRLHVTERADLDPSLLARLFGAHPPPAERLQRASRSSTVRIPL